MNICEGMNEGQITDRLAQEIEGLLGELMKKNELLGKVDSLIDNIDSIVSKAAKSQNENTGEDVANIDEPLDAISAEIEAFKKEKS